VTGWFAEFHALESGPGPGSVAHGAGREPGTLAHAAGGGPGAVGYGAGGARFAGATYDPTSHYRAAAVFDFFEEQQLTPELLREVSQHQVDLLRSRIRALDLDPAILAVEDVPLETIGGFLALQSSRAEELARALKSRGVLCDWRGNLLRLGPAPYLTDQQLEEAVGEVGEVGKGAGGRGR
jgi:kynureninase